MQCLFSTSLLAPAFEGPVDYTVLFSSSNLSIHIAFLVNNEYYCDNGCMLFQACSFYECMQLDYECLVKYPLNITLELVSIYYNHTLMLGPCPLGGSESNHLLEWCPIVNSDKNLLKASVNLTEQSMLQLHMQYSMRVHATNVFGNASTAAVNISK